MQGERVLSGGSVGLFEGKKLGRLQTLEKLKTELKDLEEQELTLDDTAAQLQQVQQQLKAQLDSATLAPLQRRRNELERELITLETRHEQLQLQHTNAEARIAATRQKSEELQKQQLQLQQQTHDAQELYEQAELNLDDLRDALQRERNRLSEAQTAANQQQLSLSQLEGRQQSLQNEQQYKAQNLQKAAAQQQAATAELQQLKQTIAETESAEGISENELVEQYQEQKAIESGVAEAEKAYYALRAAIAEHEQAERQQSRNREQTDELITQAKEQLTELRLSVQGVADRLLVEFELPLAEAQVAPEHEELPLNELEEQASKLKQRLEKFGPVNHMAIEAYAEVEDRHNFIVAQRDDLLEAKHTLEQTIGEINTVARENFMNAFAQIRENFVQVFRSLFTDQDSCDLKLLDPDDPLNSGHRDTGPAERQASAYH